MAIKTDHVWWSQCSPRERWDAFYTLYRIANDSKVMLGTTYQCFLIMLPNRPEIQRMLRCVRGCNTDWLDIPRGPIRKLIFDRMRKRRQDKLSCGLLRMIFEESEVSDESAGC